MLSRLEDGVSELFSGSAASAASKEGLLTSAFVGTSGRGPDRSRPELSDVTDGSPGSPHPPQTVCSACRAVNHPKRFPRGEAVRTAGYSGPLGLATSALIGEELCSVFCLFLANLLTPFCVAFYLSEANRVKNTSSI